MDEHGRALRRLAQPVADRLGAAVISIGGSTEDALRGLFADRTTVDRLGTLAPPEAIYPDQPAPIARLDGDDMVLQLARWGMPSPKQFHSKSGIDRGVTNIRNTGSPHWRRWLNPENRCLVPLTSFAEPAGKGKGNAWFRIADGRAAMFAGLRVPGWTSIRKLKDGETTADLYGFLPGEKTWAHRCDTAAARWSAAIGECHAAALWRPPGGGR
jgi:putative SOS response-associated peptidase YedK